MFYNWNLCHDVTENVKIEFLYIYIYTYIQIFVGPLTEK